MKFLLLLIALPLFSLAQNSEVGINGYGKIRIGSKLSEVEKYLKPTDEVPPYAWFAPLTFDRYREFIGIHDENQALTAADSAEIHLMMEQAAEMRKVEGGTVYRPRNGVHKSFMGLTIAALKIYTNEEEKIESIQIVLDKKDISDITKAQLTSQLEQKLGESWCSMSIVSSEPPFPFHCTWDDTKTGRELTVSDMFEEGGDFGESVNITYR